MSRSLFAGLSMATVLLASPASAQTSPGVLFPVPFTVEQRLVERQADGSVFQTETVRNSYGGSWLVSERPDGSRFVVDFARREMTEIRPAAGTYWVLSFDQMSDLKRRLDRADGRATGSEARRAQAAVASPTPPEIRVDEVAEESGAPRGARSGGGRRHLRASAAGRTADIWLDPAVQLSGAAEEALDRFDRAVSGRGGSPAGTDADLIGAARRRAEGAFVVRSLRRSERGVEIEEVVDRIQPLPSLPRKLVVPEDGLRRVPSPLEISVAFAEEEAARRAPALPK